MVCGFEAFKDRTPCTSSARQSEGRKKGLKKPRRGQGASHGTAQSGIASCITYLGILFSLHFIQGEITYEINNSVGVERGNA